MKYISKQFQINWRDFWNSLYLGAIVPALFALQELLDKDVTQLTWQLVAKVLVSAIVGNLIRKALEPSKVVEVTALKSAEGDPLKPKKPPVKEED